MTAGAWIVTILGGGIGAMLIVLVIVELARKGK